jgi:prevent-host-death family protein
MMATTMDIREAQARLIELLDIVMAGNEVVITQAEQPVMRLSPVSNGVKTRVAGLHAGMGWISEDFDDELPDDFWIGMHVTTA